MEHALDGAPLEKIDLLDGNFSEDLGAQDEVQHGLSKCESETSGQVLMPVSADLGIWIDADARTKAEGLIPKLLSLSQRHTSSALEFGSTLLDIKETCIKHGMFGDYLKQLSVREGVHVRTAQRCMRPAKAFQGSFEIVSVLSLDLLGRLSGKNLDKVRGDVIDLLSQNNPSRILEAVNYAEKSLLKLKNNGSDRKIDHKTSAVLPVCIESLLKDMLEIFKEHVGREGAQLRKLIEEHGLDPILSRLGSEISTELSAEPSETCADQAGRPTG